MAAKIGDELLKVLDELGGNGDDGVAEARHQAGKSVIPEHAIPVIITVTADASIAALEAKGFKLERRFEYISAVAGTLPADKQKVLRFAKDAREVELIEYDGEVRALQDTAPE